MGTFDELVAKGGRFAALARAPYLVSDKPAAEDTPSPLAQSHSSRGARASLSRVRSNGRSTRIAVAQVGPPMQALSGASASPAS